MSEQEKKQQTGKGILVIGIIAIVVVAVLVGVIIFLLVKQNTKEEKRQVLATEDNVDEILDDLVEEEESRQDIPEYYSVTMNTTWHFEDGSKESYDAMVANVEKNETAVYFDVVLAGDESQVLYSSPVIPLGGQLSNFKLDKDLDAGVYDGVVIYHLVDENQNPLSQVRVTVEIVVEN